MLMLLLLVMGRMVVTLVDVSVEAILAEPVLVLLPLLLHPPPLASVILAHSCRRRRRRRRSPSPFPVA